MQCRKEKLYNDKEGRQKSMRLTKNRAPSEPRIGKIIENATRRKAKNGKEEKMQNGTKLTITNYAKCGPESESGGETQKYEILVKIEFRQKLSATSNNYGGEEVLLIAAIRWSIEGVGEPTKPTP